MKKIYLVSLIIWAGMCFADPPYTYVSPYRTIQDPNQFGYNHDVVYPGEPGYNALYGPHGTYSVTQHPIAVVPQPIATPSAPVTVPATPQESYQAWRSRTQANAASLDTFGYNPNLSVSDEFAARHYRRAHPLEFPFRIR